MKKFAKALALIVALSTLLGIAVYAIDDVEDPKDTPNVIINTQK